MSIISWVKLFVEAVFRPLNLVNEGLCLNDVNIPIPKTDPDPGEDPLCLTFHCEVESPEKSENSPCKDEYEAGIESDPEPSPSKSPKSKKRRLSLPPIKFSDPIVCQTEKCDDDITILKEPDEDGCRIHIPKFMEMFDIPFEVPDALRGCIFVLF